MVQIAPSILSADFARLADEIRRIEQGGADLVHVDVMDGQFVPNLTIGPPVIRALSRVTRLGLDCHLMIEDADRVIQDYVDAGAARITVHAEACPHLHRTVARIRDAGLIPGVALNPASPLELLDEILPDLGQILIMTVNPGFGGQQFIAAALTKIERLKQRLDARALSIPIEVDGGVSTQNAAALVRAGAQILVAGQAIFGAADATQATQALRRAAVSG
jgi:ribulose-phosphate 3-epimerase